MQEPARISYLTLAEALQNIFIRQRTGTLTLVERQETHRLLFFSGQLYLAGDNPLRQRMEIVLTGPSDADEDPRFNPRRYLERELARLVSDLGDRFAAWDAQDLTFDEVMDEIPDDLVGPVPTGALVMDLSSRGRSESQILQRLGGLDERYRASEEVMFRRRIPELDEDEIRLLDRLERAADIRTLIAESGGQASVVLCHLARLEAVRLVAAEDESALSPLSQELLGDISQRVVASLEERPIEVDVAAHRARLSKLLREYGRQTYFELLGVDGSSSADEIHRRYMELARLAHPSHGNRLKMRDRGRRLEWLFTRLTDAYLVLSDPDRSALYRRHMAEVPAPQVRLPNDKVRRSERAGLARHNYQLAKEHIDGEDFHYAIELLRQAVLADPLPEYHLLLGRCLERNPRWLHMAVDSLREAVALRPHDSELRQELARMTHEYHRQADRGKPEDSVTRERSQASSGLASKWMRRLKGADEPQD